MRSQRLYQKRRAGQQFTQKIGEIVMAVTLGLIVFFVTKSFDLKSSLNGEAFQNHLNQVNSQASPIGRPLVEIIRDLLEPIQNGLELILAMNAALLGLMLTGYVFRLMNASQESTVAALYEADKKVLEFIDEVLEHTSKFQESSRSDSGIHVLLGEHLNRQKDAFTGFLKRIGDLDLDVDSADEPSFTIDLVEVAKRNISAVSVAEEEFYATAHDARVYLDRQIQWLAKEDQREIERIFVAPKDHGRENAKFKEMITQHNKDVADARAKYGLNDKRSRDVISVVDRYKFYTVTWNEWNHVMKERADLIIYDNKYVRRGPLEELEHRRAQFRANPADVGDAVAKFKALLAVASDELDHRVVELRGDVSEADDAAST